VSTSTLVVARVFCRVVTFRTDEFPFAVYVVLPPTLTPMLLVAAVEITMSKGSRRSVPILPAGARVSTAPVKFSRYFPETSTKPPSPAVAPPRALIDPAKFVSDSTR